MGNGTAIALAAAIFTAVPVIGAPLAADDTRAERMVKPLTPMAYVQQAAVGDMFEVQAGKIAAEKARDENVKSFAEMMVRDHSESTRMLKKAVAEVPTQADTKLKLPTKLDPRHQDLLDKLKSADIKEFDQLYMETQVQAHQDALNLHRSYAKAGKNAPLQKVAGQIAKVVEKHLEQARALAGASKGTR